MLYILKEVLLRHTIRGEKRTMLHLAKSRRRNEKCRNLSGRDEYRERAY